ncbi:GntR family transcriptional regulator, partial [Pseudomonas indica]
MGVVTMEAEGSVRRHGGRYIYEELRKQILTLQLKPGAQLDEVSLAAQFGVSRSPVRDALARLISEGLVTILPNRTTLVTPFEI